jgi:hypothetical protein
MAERLRDRLLGLNSSPGSSSISTLSSLGHMSFTNLSSSVALEPARRRSARLNPGFMDDPLEIDEGSKINISELQNAGQGDGGAEEDGHEEKDNTVEDEDYIEGHKRKAGAGLVGSNAKRNRTLEPKSTSNVKAKAALKSTKVAAQQKRKVTTKSKPKTSSRTLSKSTGKPATNVKPHQSQRNGGKKTSTVEYVLSRPPPDFVAPLSINRPLKSVNGTSIDTNDWKALLTAGYAYDTIIKGLQNRNSLAKQSIKDNDGENFAVDTYTTDLRRPHPIGSPSVWSASRNALCSTLSAYQAYQGGYYTHDGRIWGAYFDAFAVARELIQPNVVIVRSGGGMVADEKGARTLSGVEPSRQSLVQSFQGSIQQQSLVLLIVGDNCPTMPVEVPHPYNVLDHFKPTHTWCEKVDGTKIRRFRFELPEKYDKNGNLIPAWWTPRDSSNQFYPSPAPKLGCFGPPDLHTCTACDEISPQVYLNGWMCLNGDCLKFWKVHGLTEPKEAHLIYDPRFVAQKTSWANEDPPEPLIPGPFLPDPGETIASEDPNSRRCWKGMVCPNCHGCIIRKHWNAWHCETGGCGYVHAVPHGYLRTPASDLRIQCLSDIPDKIDNGYGLIAVDSYFNGGYQVTTYIFEEGNFIIHLAPAVFALEQDHFGADALFEMAQVSEETSGSLQRRQVGDITGTVARWSVSLVVADFISGKHARVTAHFSKNYVCNHSPFPTTLLL